MRKIYCTFGGVSYDATLQHIAEDGPRFGADEVWIYDEPWLMGTRFYRDHSYMWEHPGWRGVKIGFGWYCFKAYTILHALSHMQKGDVCLWTDADTFPIADFSMLYGACVREAGFFCFAAEGCSDRQWVKRDVWEAVYPQARLEATGAEISLDSQHATARFMLFEKGKAAVRTFLEEWQDLCTTKWLATRDPSISGPEFPGFEENRGDQSIFSLLCHRYGIPLHREADGFGEGSQRDRELYGQLFQQIYCAGNRADLSGSKYRRGPGI
jgi:hypothetical protein